jgi:hypothetical protein
MTRDPNPVNFGIKFELTTNVLFFALDKNAAELGKAADDGAEPVSDSDDAKRRKVDESSSAHVPPSTVVLLLNMVGRGQVDGDLEVETAEVRC